MSALTLAQAKTHLNISTTTHDVELQVFIDAAEAAIKAIIGPIAAQSVTAVIRTGDTSTLVLPIAPAISLTSVTADGGLAEDLSDFTLDEASGLVTRSAPWSDTFAAAVYTVTYSAGRSPVPADILIAIAEMVRHLWATQRGPSGRPGSPQSDVLANTLPGAAYALPIRVTQLLAPHAYTGLA